MALEKIIRESLTGFIQCHIPHADLSALDEVFYAYATGVLEELGSQNSSEEDFEMESFVEMLEAYIPGFSEISSGKVYDMLFELSRRLSEARGKENVSPKPTAEVSFMTPTSSSTESSKKIETEPLEGAVAQEKDDAKNGIDLLLEIFPSCTVSQAQTALSMAKGDLEDAVQIIVDGKVIADNHSGSKDLQGAPKTDDLKDFILQKYMLVDTEDDKKTYRPVAPKEAPKKMIRYIDNQVVSTKGERYKDIKKPESEEMKKTYINLKPARKYKFH
uniref:CUE domain-containing protein 2-A n=1 Tax=Xenopus laevis TaxID=8355 RepID=CUE2A_XENLA|nr:RecName: Full=CUE domain-containing protein 2-A; AltName: Full=Mitotic phosphoprotein 38 [Xenopus laevis]AAH68784.1 LOC398317 protein [Xenopus laevis]